MGKNSFVFHTRDKKLFNRLTKEEVGSILFAMISYTETGEEPEFEDRGTAIVWDSIKEQLDYDDQEYQKTCDKRKEAAKATRIVIYKGFDLYNETKWEEAYAWFVENAIKTKYTFKKME